MAAEKAFVIAQGTMYEGSAQLKDAVKQKDAYSVLVLLNQLNAGKELALAVADREGIVFSRTIAALGRGDNSFVIGPLGRELVRTGAPVFAIEQSGTDPSQLIISSARYLTDGGTMIGALYATAFMNDAYAERFANKYLPRGVEVVFYSHGYGVYGDSITDPELKKLINGYFYPYSSYVADGETGTVLHLPDGRYYAVLNTVFPGIEHSPGGAILLVPVFNLYLAGQIFVATIALLFCVFLIFHHHRSHKKNGLRYNFPLAFVAVIVLGSFILLVDTLPYPSSERLRPIGHVLYNSVLKITPPIQVFDYTYPQSVAVTLDTGPESINTVGVVLGYDPKAIEINWVSDNGSLCTDLLEKTVDPLKGEIRYACSLPNPGFSGAGTVFTINFKARAPGQFSFSFLPDTQVLANDGLATDVLRLATNGSYTATRHTASPALSLYSPSHPNSEQWYRTPVIDFSWGGSATSTYAYALDTSTSTSRSTAKTVTGQKLTVTAPGEGVYYFHLAELKNGKLSPEVAYKVKIDTTPPSELNIQSSDATLEVGGIARLLLSATDSGSGLQKNYYLAVNDGLFLPTHKDVYVPLTDPGTTTFTVRVYDTAGNYSEKQTHVEVQGSFFQRLVAPFIP